MCVKTQALQQLALFQIHNVIIIVSSTASFSMCLHVVYSIYEVKTSTNFNASGGSLFHVISIYM